MGGSGVDARGAGTYNEASGSFYGPLVQAGTVHGGVAYHLYEEPWSLPTPRTLPPVSSNFTNREPLLAELDRRHDEALRSDAPLVVVVTGRGGIGKSALATCWLRRIAAEFPGPHLYANLSEGGTVSAKDVLGRFLRMLGVHPRHVPASLPEMTDWYRTLLSGEPAIVFLDDAQLASQVRPLLPNSAGSVVVVTTRGGLEGLVAEVGATPIELDPLTSEASLALLSRIAGEPRISGEPEQAAALVRLCAGLPLSLCTAGVRLIGQRSVSSVIREVGEEQARLAGSMRGEDISVTAVFDACYRDLSAPGATTYRRLGSLLSPEFSVGAAAAAADLPEPEATRSLAELVRAGLAEGLGAGRYRLPGLVQQHARERASRIDTDADREAATGRVVGWYLRTAVVADFAVMPKRWRLGPEYRRYQGSPPPVTKNAAWTWLETERPALLAAVRAAARRWDELVVQLCEALWGIYFLRSYYDDWIESHRLGVEAAVRLGDRPFQARMRCQLGFAFLGLRRYDEAEEQFAAALGADREAGHLRGQATAVESLGLVSLGRGSVEGALRRFAENKTLTERVGDPRAIALAWRHLGRALSAADRHEDAIDHLVRARAMFVELPDRYNEGRALTNLGEAYIRAGRPRDAEAALGAALEAMREERARSEEAEVLVLLGNLAERSGDRSAAADRLTAALAIYDALRSPDAEEVRRRLHALTGGGE